MGDNSYSFEKRSPTFNFRGRYLDKVTLKPVADAHIVAVDMKTGVEVPYTSDANGGFELKLTPETPYHFYFSKRGYFAREDMASIGDLKYSEDLEAEYLVQPISVDMRVVLKNIYYDYDKWDIRPEASVELDKLVKFLEDNPTVDIELNSFTDTRGADLYNLDLSDKRAGSVVAYLVSKNIDPKRLTYRGYGEQMLVNACGNGVACSEEEHEANRRTEFKVISID